jgi:Carboxypeptidase regulatory-like domain/TonB-dependent Receptor Plug Domain/TonB dependent receptor
MLAALCTITPAFLAQPPVASVSWQGTLRDSSGAPIAQASVRLAGKGSHVQAATGADGRFHFSALAAGRYKLSVEARGRTVVATSPIEIAASAPAAILTLTSDGGLTVAALQSSSATGGEQLSSAAVSELPLNKRDFSQLLLLAAGTMTDANGATNFTQQFAINGQRGVEATFAMDGADISDPEMGGSTFSNFNVDAVEEIESSSGWMPAEIGRGASGFTDIITRSGASGFHGSFFEFLRNSALDARNYFDHATPVYPGRIPPFRRNEFGFTNGGTVTVPHVYDGRERTFYFTQYQGFRQALGTTQVMPVPTSDQREGLDSTAFAGDTLYVPVDPGIATVLKRYPLPNDPTGPYGIYTYATPSTVLTNANQFSARIDHRFSAKDQFFARFSFDNITGPTTNPDQTAIDPSFGVTYIDRQRNVVGTYTRTVTPRLTLVSSVSITRSTPGFPTPNRTDPAIKFIDGLFEPFNSAAGTVMQAYGNLFQGRQLFTWTAGNHAVKGGFEARLNRDTTYFGVSPDGEYDFGGGAAYANEAISSESGTHNISPGDPLPDTLSSFLSGSPFAYTVAIAPPYFSSGAHIGPAAINRENYSFFLQDTFKLSSRLTLDYGVRWDLYTPISERAHRTATIVSSGNTQQYLINPQPGFRTDWKAWQPRVQVSWQATSNLLARAGGSVMTIQPNIWQDNFLTGSTPFAVYPRLVSTPAAPVHYGFQITPAEIPPVYSTSGADIFPADSTRQVPANTPMDVNRYEQDLAALTPGSPLSDLTLSGIDPTFGNGTLFTWTAGLERKLGGLTADANYVGTASEKLPAVIFPNGYSGAGPAFARYTTFDASGNVSGGFGFENLIVAISHSTYHALQVSLAGTVGHGGPGIQAGYTWSKSIDNSSAVIGGTGSTGAVAVPFPQDPFNYHGEKGPSAFDVTHAFSLSAAQDLHLDHESFLRFAGSKITSGWECLSIVTLASGSPFTVYSGVQQTGAGSGGVDRPDQIAVPHLSTARKVREDYFGEGANNGTDFFSIPIHVVGGTGPNQGMFGTLGRNTFRGPAFYDLDFAVIKDTPFGTRKSGAELVDLQFRSEFFNIFNIVDMGLPANIVPVNSQTGAILQETGFGLISKTAGNSRQIQFSLKLIY